MITIFIDQEAQDLLDEIGASFEEAPNKLDITVEFIHLAITGVVKYDESGDLDISVYARYEDFSRDDVPAYHGTVEDMEISIDKGDPETVCIVAGISDFINNYFCSENLLDKYKDLPEESGVLVEARDGNIVTTVVTGRERPDLKCQMFSGEKILSRL